MKLPFLPIKEKPFTLLLIALAILGIVLFGYQFYEDTKSFHKGDFAKMFEPIITGQEATAKAKEYLVQNNFAPADLDKYTPTLSFISDDQGLAFLDKTQGDAKAAEYLDQKKLPTLDYAVRFYKELEVEEYNVELDASTGEITGYAHILPEEAKLDSLTQEQAQEMALAFLTKNYDPATLEKKDEVDYKQPNRTDYAVSYKVKDTELQTQYGEAHAEMSVVIQGNQIGGFSYSLFVPENFGLAISKEMSSGMFLSILSALATVFIYVLAFVIMIQKFIKKQTNWKFFLYVSLILLALLILGLVNSYPLLKFSYATEAPYLVFMGIVFVTGLIALIFSVAGIFISFVSGEALAREVWPEKITVLNKIIKKEYLSKDLAYAVGRGYLVAFISLGLTTLIYIFGEKYLGVWSLSTYQDLGDLLTYFPPLVLFTTITMAAIMEEFLYRLIGITFFRKYLKSTILAVLVTTLIWAVAHSNYPVFPYYFRAIELMITGSFFGYIFVRYNLTTMIVAHYLINGILLGSTLFFSGRLDLLVYSLVIIVLPLILGLISFFLSKKSQPTLTPISPTPTISNL
ncbi:MAG: type II CAAX endopeptidase family protein [Candidatus Parcubacteria bacterium]|nr:type II CAAX endopeptidase family protein [Candidatus Parcubacteria bacterium]